MRTAHRVADAAITPPVWKGFRSEKMRAEKNIGAKFKKMIARETLRDAMRSPPINQSASVSSHDDAIENATGA